MPVEWSVLLCAQWVQANHSVRVWRVPGCLPSRQNSHLCRALRASLWGVVVALPSPGFRLGQSVRTEEGRKRKWTVSTVSLDEICHTHTGGVFWQIVSLICYQQQQSSGSISNVLFRNPHYDNESDFDEERNQSGRLNVEWMAALNPSIISKVEWVSACPDVLRSLFLTDVYSWPCQAFYYQSYGSNSTKLPGLTAKVALWSSRIINPVTWGRQLTGWWAFFSRCRMENSIQSVNWLNAFLGLHINNTHLSGVLSIFYFYWESVGLITAPP